MSHLLWKYYWENDVDRFRRLLAPTGQSSQVAKSPAVGSLGHPGGFLGGASPVALGTSPRPYSKPRRVSGQAAGSSRSRDANATLSRAEVNSRDHAGLTVLLRAASSTEPSAVDFVSALIDHAAVDLYAQDPENGWNALHRSLYFGNASIARMLLERERDYLMSHNISSVSKVGLLIKTKDHEGNSPFDLYNSTIAMRSQQNVRNMSDSDSDSGSEDGSVGQSHVSPMHQVLPRVQAHGDELFVFGSNKNLSLGVGDEDDRQYPERIVLHRPKHLLQKFHQDYLEEQGVELSSTSNLEDIPTLLRDKALVIHDVVMSKLHSAVLTADPVCNLYMCGVGRGGRLGLGDENTQFKFAPVQGPFVDKNISHVALGQNHSMAIADNGELWTWGLNSHSQLGYSLPPPARADEDSMTTSPRQVFGALKREIVLGIAASAIHSVAHTSTSLYCWGRNAGQLALMDADSRSLDVQQSPRKVAASLLSAPIVMVAAIDKATTCLLSNHTVWVFTNFGYNLVKFPYPDVFANKNMNMASFANRYDPGRRDIKLIASGGDTIAAVNARGDLYTMHLTQIGDLASLAGSTTNPVKIKGAVTQPQCIWDSRKDGVVSTSIGENGSVLICTETGAVWQRVKRTKGKSATFVGSSDVKRKDFKFQRVPYITNCVGVRSSIFGACAAIREDSKVMTESMDIAKQGLWKDVASLSCIKRFTSSIPREVSKSRQAWERVVAREEAGSTVREVLQSQNIEIDLARWLRLDTFDDEAYDVAICSSSLPELELPVHGWVLAARSTCLRSAMSEVRHFGAHPPNEVFQIDHQDGRLVITFSDADAYTLLNILAYAYEDRIIPVWKFTRDAPVHAARFRQVRNELMKIATKLQMPKLESAARLQVDLEASLDVDLHNAMSDPEFFDDGDIILNIDGAEVMAHSQLICKRCPFFEGIFHGRSGGQWLAGRRQTTAPSDKVRIDLSHISPETFQLVLEYLYADVGVEMFDKVAMGNIDEFSELVLDVMGVANELMIDRLSQICQTLIGQFVTTRNIAILLNEISPCSVPDFKVAGLEYVCLQLEGLLENHLLDTLDEELLEELDDAVRENQLCRCPFARSGRAELLLHENNPDLAMDIEEERQRRVRAMAFKAAQKDEERKLASLSYKMRFGSFDELSATPQTPDGHRRKSRSAANEPFSPTLRPKISQADLIFDMEDEASSGIGTPRSPYTTPQQEGHDNVAYETPIRPGRGPRQPKGKGIPFPLASPISSPPVQETPPSGLSIPDRAGQNGGQSPGQNAPWASTTLQTTKLDLKNIMTETSSTTSALTSGLRDSGQKDAANNKPQAKMSQKEKKRQMQMRAEAFAATPSPGGQEVKVAWDASSPSAAPWKSTTKPPSKPTPVPDASSTETLQREAMSAIAKPLVASESSPRTTPRRTASPDTRFPGQARANSSSNLTGTPSSSQPRKPTTPHSKSYIKPATQAESMLGYSMEDIIVQQRREQEIVREAVAKRSLQEIQQEQAFQEWWDQESRRMQEEEEARKGRSKGRSKGKEKDDGKEGKPARRGRPAKSRGGGGHGAGASEGSEAVAGKGSTNGGGSGAHRGKGAKGKDVKA